YEVGPESDAFGADRHASGRLEARGALQQSEVVVDEQPVLPRRQMRSDDAQGRAGAAAEVDDAKRAPAREDRGKCIEHRSVARVCVMRLAQGEPVGREFVHRLPSMARTKTAAAASQVGSRLAAARALAASRARSAPSEITSRSAAASAVLSPGGTRSPAPAGTVSGIAPAVVPITGTP